MSRALVALLAAATICVKVSANGVPQQLPRSKWLVTCESANAILEEPNHVIPSIKCAYCVPPAKSRCDSNGRITDTDMSTLAGIDTYYARFCFNSLTGQKGSADCALVEQHPEFALIECVSADNPEYQWKERINHKNRLHYLSYLTALIIGGNPSYPLRKHLEVYAWQLQKYIGRTLTKSESSGEERIFTNMQVVRNYGNGGKTETFSFKKTFESMVELTVFVEDVENFYQFHDIAVPVFDTNVTLDDYIASEPKVTKRFNITFPVNRLQTTVSPQKQVKVTTEFFRTYEDEYFSMDFELDGDTALDALRSKVSGKQAVVKFTKGKDVGLEILQDKVILRNLPAHGRRVVYRQETNIGKEEPLDSTPHRNWAAPGISATIEVYNDRGRP